MPRIRFTDDLNVRYLGPLPILVPFLERLGLAELVDTHVPKERRTPLSHGQVVSALVLNRLLSPRAIYTLQEWSHRTVIPEALHIAASDLNDDCLLRTLDAIFPHLESIQGSLTWQVQDRFGLDTSFIHWDLTSFFFEGSYDETQQDAAAPLINYGRPKERDAGNLRKQMQVDVATTEDGGVPLWYRPFSGNAAEVSQVGDSKLISRDNMLKALRTPGLSFLGPETRAQGIKDRYLQFRAQGYRLQRFSYGRQRKPRPHIYMGFETTFILVDDQTGQEHQLRRLFIVSAEERRAARRNRRRKLAKLYDDIAKIRRNLGSSVTRPTPRSESVSNPCWRAPNFRMPSTGRSPAKAVT